MISGCDPAFGFHLMTLDESGEKILEDKKIFGIDIVFIPRIARFRM